MRKLFITFIILILGSLAQAQTPEWLWSTGAGGTFSSTSYAISRYDSTTYFMTGGFSGATYSFSSSGESDIFIARSGCEWLPLGGYKYFWSWSARAGGTGNDCGYGISTDNAGNSYVTGIFSGTAEFGNASLTSSGGEDMFIAKLDMDGNWLWAIRAGGIGNDIGYCISIDSAGNSYVTGQFQGTASFGTIMLNSIGESDIFIAKADANGNWLWAQQGGGISSDGGTGISADSAGNCYITGSYHASAGFGLTTLTSSGDEDIFIAKLDGGGNWLWAKRAGGTSEDVGKGIATDSSGNCYATGHFSGTADFGTTSLASGGEEDVFAAGLDSNGNWLWAKRAGGTGSDAGKGISTDGSGNCCLTGYFSNSAVFGLTSLFSSGAEDVFAARLDGSGIWLWAQQGGGAEADCGNGIAADSSGKSCIAGSFQGTATFGYSLTGNGSTDSFAAQLAADGNWGWQISGRGDDSDYGNGISHDDSGSSYVIGRYTGTAGFGSLSLTGGGYFIAKLDAGGNWQWAVPCGGGCSGISRVSNGAFYITGAFRGSVDFGSTTLTSTGWSDIFIAKLDVNGNWLWAKRAGGSDTWGEAGRSVATDNNGNCYVTGYYSSAANFGTATLTCRGPKDIFIAKLDTNGNWLWAKRAGGDSGNNIWDNDQGTGIAVDGSGNCYVTGTFEEIADFGPTTLTCIYFTDIFVAKLDTNGNWLWVRQAGGTAYDHSSDISTDSSGNCYITGDLLYTAGFGTTSLTSFGGYDVYAAKLDTDGNWLWAVHSGGANFDFSNGISTDSYGNSYVTGDFRETAAFGNISLISSGYQDIFVAGLDTNGNWVWAVRAGGNSDYNPDSGENDSGYGIFADNQGNCYVTGDFSGTAEFGSALLASGGMYDIDIFVAKLASGTGIEDETTPAVPVISVLYDAFPNPLRSGKSAILKTYIADRETGTLSIYNLRGQLVRSYRLNSGLHETAFESSGLASGVYLCRLRTPSVSMVKKLVLLK